MDPVETVQDDVEPNPESSASENELRRERIGLSKEKRSNVLNWSWVRSTGSRLKERRPGHRGLKERRPEHRGLKRDR